MFNSIGAARVQREAVGRTVLGRPIAPQTTGESADRRRLLLAARAYHAGETVFALEHVRWWAGSVDQTVAHPSGRQFHDPLLDGVVHADDPNCVLSLDLMALLARRDIAPGETISRDFNATRSAPP